MMRQLPVLLILIAAAGCAMQPQQQPQQQSQQQESQQQESQLPAPTVNLSGYPPEFRQGYADGCASVNAARKRDEARFKKDTQYAQGWRDGYDICQRRK
jgi:hemolysin activation/secretion protein